MEDTDVLEELKRLNSGLDLALSYFKLMTLHLNEKNDPPLLSDILKELRFISAKLTQYNDNVALVLSKKLHNIKLQHDTILKLNKYLDDWV